MLHTDGTSSCKLGMNTKRGGWTKRNRQAWRALLMPCHATPCHVPKGLRQISRCIEQNQVAVAATPHAAVPLEICVQTHRHNLNYHLFCSFFNRKQQQKVSTGLYSCEARELNEFERTVVASRFRYVACLVCSILRILGLGSPLPSPCLLFKIMEVLRTC